MLSTSPFHDLHPELFTVILSHVPFVYLSSTVLSLALTCHRINQIVNPYLLYNAALFAGDQAEFILDRLREEAQGVTGEDIQKGETLSPSHCIHHLCIGVTMSTAPLLLDALRKLIDVGGLRNLSSLTLDILENWPEQWETMEHWTDPWVLTSSSFWQSLKIKCPRLESIRVKEAVEKEEWEEEWIDRDLFSFEGFSSVRLQGSLYDYPHPMIGISTLPLSLHTLELTLLAYNEEFIDASGPDGLFNCVMPNLRTLIIDNFIVSDPTIAKRFWTVHPGIERLELGRDKAVVEHHWFDDFESGMLPNLKYLKCNALSAIALMPHVSATLVSFCLLEAYNAQGPYILREVAANGILPALRSLGIQTEFGNGRQPWPWPGHRWREDENGVVTQADAKEPERVIDGNYIMSISKAAPNLEELELIGQSDDTIDSIVASLSRLAKLQRLTLSGAFKGNAHAFFFSSYFWKEYQAKREDDTSFDPEGDYGMYAPESFEIAVRDLGNGCRTLDTVSFSEAVGELLIHDGLSARFVRERPCGEVKELRRIRALGNIIGREDEW